MEIILQTHQLAIIGCVLGFVSFVLSVANLFR